MRRDGDSRLFHACYRRELELSEPVTSAVVNIAAHTLYKLHVNGEFAMFGPARNPAAYRFVDSVDVSARRRAGRNVIAVEVMDVNVKEASTCEYDVGQPGFCLTLDIKTSSGETLIRSDRDWACMNWSAYDQNAPHLRGYPSESQAFDRCRAMMLNLLPKPALHILAIRN